MHGPLASVRVGAAFVALFSVNAAAMAWLPVWLEGRGLTAAQIGFVVAAGLAVRTVAAPLGGFLADAFGRPRAVLAATGLALLLGHALLPVAGPVWAIAGAVALTAAGMGPAIPLLEIVSVRLAQQSGPAFGPMRAVASLAFMATTAALGGLIEARGDGAALVWLILGSALFLTATLTVLPIPRAEPHAPGTRSDVLKDLLAPPLLLAFAVSALIQASHAAYYGFGSLAWREQGLGDGLIGALWAWGVAAEAALIWCAGRLERLGLTPVRLLILGAAGAALRWGLMALEPGGAGLFAVQTLHALSFGAAHLGIVLFIRDVAPARAAATAIGVNSALTFGVVLSGATALAGLLYEQGGPWLWLVMAGIAAAGLAVALGLAAALSPRRGAEY
jgi:PPP family 3-phenylpropionic acid transporter